MFTFVDVCTSEITTYICPNTCVWVCIAPLFIIASNWVQALWALVDKWGTGTSIPRTIPQDQYSTQELALVPSVNPVL